MLLYLRGRSSLYQHLSWRKNNRDRLASSLSIQLTLLGEQRRMGVSVQGIRISIVPPFTIRDVLQIP